jgi:hypothetical protein
MGHKKGIREIVYCFATDKSDLAEQIRLKLKSSSPSHQKTFNSMLFTVEIPNVFQIYPGHTVFTHVHWGDRTNPSYSIGFLLDFVEYSIGCTNRNGTNTSYHLSLCNSCIAPVDVVIEFLLVMAKHYPFHPPKSSFPKSSHSK